MEALRVRVLGKLHLQKGEIHISTFPTRRVEELLGYLLLHQGVRHPREKLVDTLWPDFPLSNGRASLSTALWRLRKVFSQLNLPAEEYVHSSRDWIAFDPPEQIEMDLQSFQNYLAEAEKANEEWSGERAFRAAIALYRGQLCEGVYSEWCLLAREQIERHYLRALGRLMSGHIHRQEYEEAIFLGKEILERDPLREEVHRALMRCYWKMGQRPRAVRQFQQCARLLQSELQILPMPETIHLFKRIVEDRLDHLYIDGRDAAPYTRELQAAFHAFLVAAGELDALLDLVEQHQEAPLTVSA